MPPGLEQRRFLLISCTFYIWLLSSRLPIVCFFITARFSFIAKKYRKRAIKKPFIPDGTEFLRQLGVHSAPAGVLRKI
jgi:hypothetical protein